MPFMIIHGQQKFVIKSTTTKDDTTIYSIVNEIGIAAKVLDTSKYIICLTEDQPGYFALFGVRGESGWIAIDFNENKLFKVFNTSYGEVSPDEIHDNKIRIIDEHNKIGFADAKGNIVIKPQFEMVSSFHKGKAIIGESCDKIPWEVHPNTSDCHHYTIVCKKHGYINEKGEVVVLGDYTFEQIVKKIKWKAHD